MKRVILIAVIICVSMSYSFSQALSWQFDEEKGVEFPIGVCTWEALQAKPLGQILDSVYAEYTPKSETISALHDALKNDKWRGYSLHIVTIFGGWCGDSHELVPALKKIINNLNVNQDLHVQLTFVGCDRTKTISDPNFAALNVDRVPTFVIYKEAQAKFEKIELGRIIEATELFLEDDILNIINH